LLIAIPDGIRPEKIIQITQAVEVQKNIFLQKCFDLALVVQDDQAQDDPPSSPGPLTPQWGGKRVRAIHWVLVSDARSSGFRQGKGVIRFNRMLNSSPSAETSAAMLTPIVYLLITRVVLFSK
jgi:hypothetical protein